MDRAVRLDDDGNLEEKNIDDIVFQETTLSLEADPGFEECPLEQTFQR